MAVSSLLSSSQITSLIQQASAAFQLPAATLQTQEQPIKAQISALGKVQGALSGLQSALSGLSDVQTLAQRTVTSSSAIVQANATNAASVGSYALSNIHLANAESLVSSGSSSSSGSLGSGSIAIQVGSGSAVTINIASGSSSLAGIASAIDQANVGVTASVIFDGSTYHLILAGNATGTANAFTVSGTGSLAGLSSNIGASGLTQTQAATNATFSLNGIPVTSSTNAVSGVIPGLSLTLAGSGSATISVSQSVAGLDSAAQTIVHALNSTLGTINQQTAFSPTSGGAPLLGNIGVELLRTGILNALTAPIGFGASAGGAFTSLSSVGFGITSGGTVTFDDAAFQAAAQSNYTAVAALLGSVGRASNAAVSVQGVASAPPGTYAVNVTSNSNGSVVGTVNGLAASGTGGVMIVTDPGTLHGFSLQIQPGVTGALGTVTVSQGLFGALSSLVSSALASGSGSVTGTVASLGTTITGMDKQIAALLQEATQETQLLTAQFSAAQATLNQLSTVSNFLTSYFNQSSGGSGG